MRATHTPTISAMDNLDLPTIKVQREGDQVVATHKPTQSKLAFPVQQLERWIIQKFRGELFPTKLKGDK